MKNDKFLVLGGTGKTGRRVVQRLEALGHEVRVASRGSEPSFDWSKPEEWEAVLEGMDKAYVAYYPDLAVPGSKEAITQLVKIAERTGLKKMVILSGRGEPEAQECEQIALNSNINTVVVRVDWFMQNFSEYFFLDPIKAGVVAVPQAETKIPFVDLDDVADVALKALLEDRFANEVLELTGPDLINFGEVVEEISKATGRDIQYIPISIEEYTQMLREHQVPEDFVWLITYLFTNVLDGRNASTTNNIEIILGRPAKSFSTFAKEIAVTGIWDAAIPESAG
ncbi:MAG: NmrA family transcriptional regulator [Eudoraea sp.]|nr:NmrA family transcriptional regulator [Eudoraea sp.]